MSLQNRNLALVLARAPVPVSQVQPQAYTVATGLMTPISKVGLATQTGMPFSVTSINGDTTAAQTIVGSPTGAGITVTTKDGITTISSP